MTLSLGIPANFDARGVGVDTHYRGEVKTASGIIVPPPSPIPDPPGAWDLVNNKPATDKEFFVGDTNGEGVLVNQGGTRFYFFSSTTDQITAYTIDTLDDISDSTLISSKSIASELLGVVGGHISFDETKIYLVGFTAQAVFQYSLTPGDFTNTFSYTGKFFDLSPYTSGSGPTGIYITPDESMMFIARYSGGNTITRFTLVTPGDVDTAILDVGKEAIIAEGLPRGIFFKPDGTQLYKCSDNGDRIRQYNLSTAWEPSTHSLDVSAFIDVPSIVHNTQWKSNGSKIYYIGNNPSRVTQRDVSL